MQCAQEILSVFILKIVSTVKQVHGKTTRIQSIVPKIRGPHRARTPRRFENSLFLDLASEIVDVGVAHDIIEAHTLIIPAFARYGLLPEPTADAAGAAGGGTSIEEEQTPSEQAS